MPRHAPGSRNPLHSDQLQRYMPQVQQQRQELRLVEAAWDNLALLSSLSRLSSKASANNDLARARHDFAALSAEMMQGLASEALKNVLEDLSGKAQMCIDIVVRNLFERSADIGFFATDAVLAQYLAHPEDADRAAMEQHLQAYASKYTVYRNIVLFDTRAQCQARLRYGDHTPDQTSAADQAFLNRVVANAGTYVQDYAMHGFCDPARPTLVYAQSVSTPQGVSGVLCLEFDLHDEAQSLFASILDDSPRGDGAQALLALVDPEGRVIASSDALQLPMGWHLPGAGTAGSFGLQHMGRRYMAVACDTTGFQGYTGLGWRGLALLPLDMAFDDEVHEEESELMQEAAGNADLLPAALRQIPLRSAAIQSALERSVWNGLLELNHVPSDGSDAQARDVMFAKTLLSEIGVTAQKTAQAFAMALHDLHRVVMASTLRDTQSRTALAMQILDRNLYERANDCRWWALTAQFAETLQAGTPNCALSTQTLKTINALYTVYSCLVLFDRQGRVVAVSNDQYADQVGQVLDEAWVGSTLRLGSSQEYVVSALAPSRFYPDAPTYIYSAAVRASASDTAPVLGGIAIVWDASAQMQSILADCATGLGPEDTLLFVDAQGAVVHSHGPRPADLAVLHTAQETAQPIVDLQGDLYGLGGASGPGYREFGGQNGYQHDLQCLALRRLCERQAKAPEVGSVQTTHHGAGNTATPSLQLATFSQGTYWLGLDATLIHMAAPDGKVLAAASVQAPFSGMVQVQNKVYPVLDLRNVVNDQSTQSPAADAARQLIVVQVPLENGSRVEFALRVDRLGAMLDLDRRQLQAINMPHNAAPSMVDAVVRFDAAAGETPGVLCQLSKTWLQYCVGTLRGDYSAQDLAQFQA